ncbi:MAG: hypothetical protein ABIZ56_05575 [Chthoniobacteraceae bacterium]
MRRKRSETITKNEVLMKGIHSREYKSYKQSARQGPEEFAAYRHLLLKESFSAGLPSLIFQR